MSICADFLVERRGFEPMPIGADKLSRPPRMEARPVRTSEPSNGHPTLAAVEKLPPSRSGPFSPQRDEVIRPAEILPTKTKQIIGTWPRGPALL